MSEWISVGERTPNREGLYWVWTAQDDSLYPSGMLSYWNGDWKLWDDDGWNGYEESEGIYVTHWQAGEVEPPK